MDDKVVGGFIVGRIIRLDLCFLRGRFFVVDLGLCLGLFWLMFLIRFFGVVEGSYVKCIDFLGLLESLYFNV